MVIRVKAENLVDLVFRAKDTAELFTVWVDGEPKEVTMDGLINLLHGDNDNLTESSGLEIYHVALFSSSIVEQFPEPLRSLAKVDFWRKYLGEDYSMELFWHGYNTVYNILLCALPETVDIKPMMLTVPDVPTMPR